VTYSQYYAEVEARAKAATEGPVNAWDNFITVEALKGERGTILAEFFGGNPMHGDNSNDTAFYAAARTDIPALVARCRELQGALEKWLYLYEHRAMMGAALADVIKEVRAVLGKEKP
jgi:hypothetical protein